MSGKLKTKKTEFLTKMYTSHLYIVYSFLSAAGVACNHKRLSSLVQLKKEKKREGGGGGGGK